MITSDATVTGTVTDDGSVNMLTVEVDLDGDGVADDYTFTDDFGVFVYDGSPDLVPGEVTIHFRATEWDSATSQEIAGVWKEISFTWQADPNDPAVVTQLGLENDTGASSTDMVTTDGTISGIVTNDGDVDMILVEIDFDGDDIADDYTWTDSSGVFVFDPAGMVAFGNVSIQVRPVETDPFTLQEVFGTWQSISFTLEEPFEVTSLELNNDTGTPGDNSTTDPTVQGQISGTGSLEGVFVSIDVDGDGVADTTATTDSNGEFVIDLSSYVSYGSVTVAVQIGGGTWSQLTFEYVSG